MKVAPGSAEAQFPQHSDGGKDAACLWCWHLKSVHDQSQGSWPRLVHPHEDKFQHMAAGAALRGACVQQAERRLGSICSIFILCVLRGGLPRSLSAAAAPRGSPAQSCSSSMLRFLKLCALPASNLGRSLARVCRWPRWGDCRGVAETCRPLGPYCRRRDFPSCRKHSLGENSL